MMALIHNFTFSQCLCLYFLGSSHAWDWAFVLQHERKQSPSRKMISDHSPAEASRCYFSDFLQPLDVSSWGWGLCLLDFVFPGAGALSDQSRCLHSWGWRCVTRAPIPCVSDCRMSVLPCHVDTSNTAFQKKTKPDSSFLYQLSNVEKQNTPN